MTLEANGMGVALLPWVSILLSSPCEGTSRKSVVCLLGDKAMGWLLPVLGSALLFSFKSKKFSFKTFLLVVDCAESL